MTLPFDDQTAFTRLPTVERALSGGRRLVQPVDVDSATQLGGSAPIIWDLVDEFPSVNAVLPEVQRMFSDSPDVIIGGIRTAFALFLEGELMFPTSPGEPG